MSTLTTIAIVVGLILLFAFAEWALGKAITPIMKPIERDCQKLPHKTKISLVVALLVIAACAWIYGCSRSGF
jgi:hypothetical protein